MDVVVPAVESSFDSACNTPYASAPSSPRGLERYYTSAPTSPHSAAAIYDHFRGGSTGASSSTNPFGWEEKTTSATATNKNGRSHEGEEENYKSVVDGDDFAFEFSGQLAMGSGEPVTATADELFEAGKIRPLRPPPRVQVAELIDQGGGSIASSPKSPKSPMSRVFRRRRGEEDSDPFVKETEETIRGRERTNPLATGSFRASRRSSRSLSPLRGVSSVVTATTTTATTTVATTKIGSKKWRLKDFFLFRSASEGRVTGNNRKDPLRKYTAAVAANDVKSSSFRSTDSGSGSMRRLLARDDSGSVVGSSRRALASVDGGSIRGSSRRGASAHEVHYAANRAASVEMRRKTFLPYRQGLLGCLGFNPSMEGLGKAVGAIAGGHRRRWA